jgi:hypothetical protein
MRSVQVCVLVAFVAAVASAALTTRDAEHRANHHTAMQRYRDVATAADPAALVDIFVNDTIDSNGWIGLKLHKRSNASNSQHDGDGAVRYAAGYLEGRSLQHRIYQAWVNTVKPTPTSTLAPEVEAWLTKNLAFMETHVGEFNTTDPFWREVGLQLVQLRGLADGYAAVAPVDQQLTHFDLFVYNMQYELEDIAAATQASAPVESYLYTKGGCTGVVVPTADDLVIAHTTWTSYTTMIRVYRDVLLGNVRMAYTGYAGMLASQDDWYMLSSNLTVMETTNLQFNPQILRDFAQPTSVSEFVRVMVANELAVDGNSWTNTFIRYNSGTYNNQYMVVDLNLYVAGTPKSQLPDNLLWIVEQMPGMGPMADVTEHIRRVGYWGSYNRAYFGEVANASGLTWANEHYACSPPYFTHYGSPRALILDRFYEQGNLSDAAGVKRFMRFNEWETDPLSICPGCENPRHNPFYTISARGDLVPHGANTSLGVLAATGLIGPAMPFGATDAKVTTARRQLGNFTAEVVSGPTKVGQPPFRWSTSWIVENLPARTVSHVGQADLQAFDWVDSSVLVPL